MSTETAAARLHLDNAAVRLTRVSSPDGEVWRLRISDETSGVRIAEIELDDTAFSNLMARAQAEGTAEVATPDRYQWVGRKRTVTSESVPSEVTAGKYGEDARELVENYAVGRAAERDADSVRIDSTRDGWRLVFSTWAPRTT